MKLKYLIFFLVVISFSNFLYSYACPWTLCEDIETFGTVKQFTLDSCNSEICRFYPGQNITGRVIFIPSVNSTFLTISMKAKIFCHELNYTQLETDGCISSGIDCPIQKESIVTYPLSVTIPEFWREIKKTVSILEIFDERGKNLVCIKIPTQIYTKSRPKGYRNKYIA
ncbi:hypothetical protein MXB_3395 [Myxobolus squamalis]|nr:hypothetical protein MXB_3395 [Myxobolus squamalis]